MTANEKQKVEEAAVLESAMRQIKTAHRITMARLLEDTGLGLERMRMRVNLLRRRGEFPWTIARAVAYHLRTPKGKAIVARRPLSEKASRVLVHGGQAAKFVPADPAELRAWIKADRRLRWKLGIRRNLRHPNRKVAAA